MSFNKRYFNIEGFINIYSLDGIKGIKKTFDKIDGFIFEDNKSSKVYDLIIDKKEVEAIKLLDKEFSKSKKNEK